MIEIIEKSKKQFHSQIALQIGRYKRLGYCVVGVGYPFFYKEYQNFISSCDFFVDDLSDPFVKEWSHFDNIKDISQLKTIEKFIILYLSANRYSELQRIQKDFPNAVIIKVLSENDEILQTLQDIEKSKLLSYRMTEKAVLDIDGSIIVNGKSLIEQTTSSKITIRSVELNENAAIYNRSRFEHRIDALTLCKSSYLFIGLDGQTNIRNCYVDKNSRIHVYSGCIKIDDVYVGENCVIHVYDKLSIGRDTIISWNVNILDGDGHSLYYKNKINKPEGICIEDKVWIGNNVTILKGVTIGEGSVVGAGSLVVNSIPSHSLAVGNPAKVLQDNICWEYNHNF